MKRNISLKKAISEGTTRISDHVEKYSCGVFFPMLSRMMLMTLHLTHLGFNGNQEKPFKMID